MSLVSLPSRGKGVGHPGGVGFAPPSNHKNGNAFLFMIVLTEKFAQ